MFSKMMSKELETDCLPVYFSRTGECGGDFFMLLQSLEGNGDSHSDAAARLCPVVCNSYWVRRIAQT